MLIKVGDKLTNNYIILVPGLHSIENFISHNWEALTLMMRVQIYCSSPFNKKYSERCRSKIDFYIGQKQKLFGEFNRIDIF